MTLPSREVPWPLMSEDSDWYAFPGDWSKRQVASELVHNLMDWWLDDNTWLDDDDKVHGWVSAYRSLFGCISPGFIRPQHPDDDGDALYDCDWFYETTADHPRAIPAVVVKL